MKHHPLGHLGDAVITLAMLIALVAGAPIRWVVGIYLSLEILSHLMKSVSAALDQIVKVLPGNAR